MAMSLLTPGRQTFEAIDHLVAPVVGGHDANGQFRGIVGELVNRSGSQGGVGGPQAPYGQESEIACRLTLWCRGMDLRVFGIVC
jgi:hypothetical protein